MPLYLLYMEQLITNAVLAKAITFEQYMELTKQIAGSTNPVGIYSNPSTHRYTRSNLERMNKVLEYMTVQQKLYNALSDVKEEWVWLVLSEPWCGDASWGTPALYVLSTVTDKIEFRILLRDEHPEIMKAYQTEGSDSIPKLICLRKSGLKELGTWGPRPKALQGIITALRSQPNIDYRESVRALHAWYDADMTHSIQHELIDLVKEWSN